MLVEVVRRFRLKGQPLNVGSVLDVPEELLERFGDRIAPLGITVAEREYYRALERWWTIDDDPTVTAADAGRLLALLEELYALLRSNGRNVPVRLPVEKKKEAA